MTVAGSQPKRQGTFDPYCRSCAPPVSLLPGAPALPCPRHQEQEGCGRDGSKERIPAVRQPVKK